MARRKPGKRFFEDLELIRARPDPGGRIVLDGCSLAAFARRVESANMERFPAGGFWSARPHDPFLNSCKCEAEKVPLENYVIAERAGAGTIYNWLRYFSPERLAAELGRSGPAAREVFAGVAGVPFDPEGDEFAVVAGRRAEVIPPAGCAAG
jgi:hypothetical protein